MRSVIVLLPHHRKRTPGTLSSRGFLAPDSWRPHPAGTNRKMGWSAGSGNDPAPTAWLVTRAERPIDRQLGAGQSLEDGGVQR